MITTNNNINKATSATDARVETKVPLLTPTRSYFHLISSTDVNKSLLNLHKVAEENNDPQLCDFIESEYLQEQVEAIKKIADLVTQLNRVGGDGLGRTCPWLLFILARLLSENRKNLSLTFFSFCLSCMPLIHS